MKKSEKIGVLLAILGVLLFSAKAVLVKLSYQYDVDTITLLALRMGFAIPFYIIIGLFKMEKGKEKLNAKSFFILFLIAVMGYYVASFFDFWGLQYIDASLERLVLFAYPTIVVILGAVLLKTKPTIKQLVAILITYGGLSVIFIPNLLGYDEPIKYIGVGFVLISAFTYATFLVGSQYFIPKIGAIRFTTFAMIVACLSVLIHYFLSGSTDILNQPIQVYVYAILMAVFSTVIPSFLIAKSIQLIGANKVAIIGSLGPVSTIVLSVIFLDEQILLSYIVGGLIIILGVLWLNLEKNKIKY